MGALRSFLPELLLNPLFLLALFSLLLDAVSLGLGFQLLPLPLPDPLFLQSTIREERDRLLAELDGERQRGDEERFRADQERTRAESLERELEEARRPWWRRWFG